MAIRPLSSTLMLDSPWNMPACLPTISHKTPPGARYAGAGALSRRNPRRGKDLAHFCEHISLYSQAFEYSNNRSSCSWIDHLLLQCSMMEPGRHGRLGEQDKSCPAEPSVPPCDR